MTWQCVHCGELNEDGLAVCKRCGQRRTSFVDPSDTIHRNALDELKQAVDHPEPLATPYRRTGLAFSKWADFALLWGQLSSLIGCLLTVVIGILLMIDTYSRYWVFVLLAMLIALLNQLALLVVFTRVRRL